MKTVLTATAFATLSFAAIADVPESDVVRCAAIVPDGERLACYDAIADKVSAAASIAATRRAEAAALARQEAAAAAEAARQAAANAFGAEDVAAIRRESRNSDDNEIQATIMEVLKDLRGRYVLLLDNGQTWRQLDGTLYKLKRGETVRIKRRAISGYRLSFDKINQTVAVERLR
jgi:hypothetical protein